MEIVLVGLVSSYKEGRLIQGAVRPLLEACDRVYVYEGPAGDPITADVPETDLGPLVASERLTVRQGRWRTDARKRSDMLKRVKAEHAGGAPLWGVWLDGDEVLINGELLRDWLQLLQWHDEQHPEQPPHLGRPLRLIELDGSVSWMRGRVLRVDLVQRFDVSNATFVNQHGIMQGGGNFPDVFSDWQRPRQAYFESDQIVQFPPIAGEPHVLHRSALRHPLRAGNRMHQQEADEIAKRKEAAA